MTSLKLLAVFAHPDDESMGMGGTLAKYAAEGIETHLVCGSRGERGWFGPEEQYPGPEHLGQLRTKELEEAVKVLGIKTLSFLEYMDGDVDKANHAEAAKKIATHIRKIQPQVVVTFGPDGGYGHPDHIAVSQFTTAAIINAADANYKDLESQPAFQVQKFYYMVDGEDFVNMVMPFMEDMSFPVDDEIRGEVAWKNWSITTRIDVMDHCKTAWKAIQCHQSQLATLGALADADETTAVQVLSLQGTFYRVFSLVNGGRQIEVDLFEGLR